VRGGREQAAASPGETVAVQELLDSALRGSRSRQVKLEVAPDLPCVTVDRQSFEHRLAVMMAALRSGGASCDRGPGGAARRRGAHHAP